MNRMGSSPPGHASPANEKPQLVLLSSPLTGTIAKTSSVLQRNFKLYGPMNALKAEEGSSCWNSDASEDQKRFLIEFGRTVQLHELRLQFQAGFVAEVCDVQIRASKDTWEAVDEFEPSDNHDIQVFSLKQGCNFPEGKALRIIFDEFKDFYGRVTLYRIEVWGTELCPEGS